MFLARGHRHRSGGCQTIDRTMPHRQSARRCRYKPDWCQPIRLFACAQRGGGCVREGHGRHQQNSRGILSDLDEPKKKPHPSTGVQSGNQSVACLESMCRGAGNSKLDRKFPGSPCYTRQNYHCNSTSVLFGSGCWTFEVGVRFATCQQDARQYHLKRSARHRCVSKPVSGKRLT